MSMRQAKLSTHQVCGLLGWGPRVVPGERSKPLPWVFSFSVNFMNDFEEDLRGLH